MTSEAWKNVQGSLRQQLNPQAWEIWIRPISLHVIADGAVHLQVPNRFFKDWVQANYEELLRSEFSSELGSAVQVIFKIAQGTGGPNRRAGGKPTRRPTPQRSQVTPATAPVVPPQARPTPPTAPPVIRPDLIERTDLTDLAPGKTFDSFIIGDCNQFAHAASLAVADTPGDRHYNPLFIYGSTGLGKTHLLNAIGHHIRRHRPETRILYVTAEEFTNELIESLRYKKMSAFREKYRKREPTLLMIDDVQFFSGKDRTQSELFHTFEWLHKHQHQIVFTADVLPREIDLFMPRLRSRCESGMLADMQPPDHETLVAIIHQKAAEQGLDVNSDLANFIGNRALGSVREIEGVINRLSRVCQIQRTQPTIELARVHLGNMLPINRRKLTAEEIVEKVANFYNITVQELKGKRRHKHLVTPRHVAMYLVRQHTAHSFPDIGRTFGRDNATVQYACRKITRELKKDADLQNAISALERTLGC